MQFDEFDKQMRVFETTNDAYVLPGIYLVARLDGRSFTRLTKETHPFLTPFDEAFRDAMLETTEHLMDCGFRVIYAYTHSDEISLLFHPEESAYNRLMRKYISILAGEASAKLSLLLGDLATFDCRISQLPAVEQVLDYFSWRSEDARRNALTSHCYWALRKAGKTPKEAGEELRGLSFDEKNELLAAQGIDFESLPGWQKSGIGLLWETYEKSATDPTTDQEVLARRYRVARVMELPDKEAYAQLLTGIIDSADSKAEQAALSEQAA
jgi:tRNA(His) guanylyltransferase